MSAPDGPRQTVASTTREVLPDVALGLAVLVVGLVEVSRTDRLLPGLDVASLGIVVGFAAASAMARKAPGVGLVIVWAACAVQVITATPLLLVELSVAVVAFGCARWGSRLVLVVSGLSIPVAAALGALLAAQGSYYFFRNLLGLRRLLDVAYQFGDALVAGAVLLGGLALAVPWLAGLALRATVRAQIFRQGQLVAEEQADEAQEVARLRDEQARLANDVHDVVGHSLAVILAQAESAQFLDDPERLKTTLANIAGSARSSLQDVRNVLSTDTQALYRPARFDELVDGVRSAGREVTVDEEGTPRPLPPELDEVVHRVAQEMLTNAVKHGRRDQPIRVRRHWPAGSHEETLRLEVVNPVPRAPEVWPSAAQAPGRGLDGMRRRLEAVGGRLDVERREGPEGAEFAAEAWVPLRGARPLAG